MFYRWQENSGYKSTEIMKRNAFYKGICAKGYEVKQHDGLRYFFGLGESKDSNAVSNNASSYNDNI